MPKGKAAPKMSGKVIYLPNPYTPEEQERFLDRAAKAFWDAFEELEAKGLMPKVKGDTKAG